MEGFYSGHDLELFLARPKISLDGCVSAGIPVIPG